MTHFPIHLFSPDGRDRPNSGGCRSTLRPVSNPLASILPQILWVRPRSRPHNPILGRCACTKLERTEPLICRTTFGIVTKERKDPPLSSVPRCTWTITSLSFLDSAVSVGTSSRCAFSTSNIFGESLWRALVASSIPPTLLVSASRDNSSTCRN